MLHKNPSSGKMSAGMSSGGGQVGMFLLFRCCTSDIEWHQLEVLMYRNHASNYVLPTVPLPGTGPTATISMYAGLQRVTGIAIRMPRESDTLVHPGDPFVIVDFIRDDNVCVIIDRSIETCWMNMARFTEQQSDHVAMVTAYAQQYIHSFRSSVVTRTMFAPTM